MITKGFPFALLAIGLLLGCGGSEEQEQAAEEVPPAAVPVSEMPAVEPEPAAPAPDAQEEAPGPETEEVAAALPDSAAEDMEPTFPEIPLPDLPAPESRRAAPEIVLKDLAGREIALRDLRGEVLLINFWATWCPPCKKEIPQLIHLQETYAPFGFRVLGLSIDQNGLAAVKPFVRGRKEINYTIIPNGRRAAQLLGGINSIPTSFVLDREGRIIYKLRGYDAANALEGYVQAALREAVLPEPVEIQVDSTLVH